MSTINFATGASARRSRQFANAAFAAPNAMIAAERRASRLLDS